MGAFRFSAEQLRILEAHFQNNHYAEKSLREYLTQILNLREHQVKNWFQNRRTKARLAQKKVQEPTMSNYWSDSTQTASLCPGYLILGTGTAIMPIMIPVDDDPKPSYEHDAEETCEPFISNRRKKSKRKPLVSNEEFFMEVPVKHKDDEEREQIELLDERTSSSDPNENVRNHSTSTDSLTSLILDMENDYGRLVENAGNDSYLTLGLLEEFGELSVPSVQGSTDEAATKNRILNYLQSLP